MNIRRFSEQFVTNTMLNRRSMICKAAAGMGAVAFASIYARNQTSLAPENQPTMNGKKAKSVIFLFMEGAPSHVDTFDPKPRLTKEDGKPFPLKAEKTQFDTYGPVYGSPWKFHQFGKSGIAISELFPHLSAHADKLAVIRSAVSPFSEHAAAECMLHTGSNQLGRPSMGAWLQYGLGCECDNLPRFIVLSDGRYGRAGKVIYNSGFLPQKYQASYFQPKNPPFPNIEPESASIGRQESVLKLTSELDRGLFARLGNSEALASAIANQELAFRMQTSVPDLMDIRSESDEVQTLYGLNDPPTALYGSMCLQARRMVERGVQFVELVSPSDWDVSHNDLKGTHETASRAVDRPIAGLLTDLAQRGLLESTLVVWAAEFGRTPFAQAPGGGRDHNPYGFSIWMAGGGINPGTIYGATDEYGYRAIENPVTIHDIHATMLALLGLDHRALVFRFGGRDMRLTDVAGRVIAEVIA